MTRAARSLDTLLAQINAFAPNRSKVSDGGIADARHLAAGTSDHIADRSGVFHARDFTHDPAGGFDAYAFADRLLAAQDRRLKYVISHGRIGSGPAGTDPGVWRRYPGVNAHDHHTHVSVIDGALAEATTPWGGVRPGPTLLTSKPSTIIDLTGDDEMSPEDRALLHSVDAKLDWVLGQFGYTDGAWKGWDVWSGETGADGKTPLRLTLVDLLRATHRELNQRFPGRDAQTPTKDTLLGHVLNVARDGAKLVRKTGA